MYIASFMNYDDQLPYIVLYPKASAIMGLSNSNYKGFKLREKLIGFKF